ncbi:MAG: dipeptidase [Hyphomicrobiaceae bacterium]
MSQTTLQTNPVVPVFDGHNDVLLRLATSGFADPVAAFLDGSQRDGRPRGQLDLPRARAGGLVGGLYAIFVPSRGSPLGTAALVDPPDAPPASEVDRAGALATTLDMAALLMRIEAASAGAFTIATDATALRAAISEGRHAAVLHIEGAEAIDPDLTALDVLYSAGLRSLGPVWSRSNIFAHGVPFRFNSSPDTGPGLTDAGRRLVKRCNALGIVVDLSHLNEQGFWDIAKMTEAPLCASHSNAHALSPHARNLTDRQLAAIRDSGGLVGVNYAVSFLRPDGQRSKDTTLDLIVDHMVYLLERLGEDGVALGSDFDGATIPADLGSVAGLPRLVERMRARQLGESVIRKVCADNWIGLLSRTWKSAATTRLPA